MHDPAAGTSARVVLIGGGARCGKSGFALERAAALGARRVFVATAQASDDEMAQRIARHQHERGAGFTGNRQFNRLKLHARLGRRHTLLNASRLVQSHFRWNRWTHAMAEPVAGDRKRQNGGRTCQRSGGDLSAGSRRISLL